MGLTRMPSSHPKVITIINRLDIGGTAVNTIPLVYELRNDFDILVLYGAKESDEAAIKYLLENNPGIAIQKIKSLNRGVHLIDDVIGFITIIKAIKTHKAEIVHTHGSKAGLLGRLAAWLLRVPVRIHTFHGHLFHSYFNRITTRAVIQLETFLSKISTSIIALSREQKHELVHVFKIANEAKVHIIPLGIDQQYFCTGALQKRENFRRQFNVSDSDLAIGIVGRIAPIKNHLLFIDTAISLLKEGYGNITFLIVGDGEQTAEIKKYLAQKKVSFPGDKTIFSKIIFTSWYTNIAEVQNGLDILVLTSHNEGTPLSVIEAQICGKPVIATNVGGVKDIIINEKTGFLVEHGNMKQLKERLKDLIDNKELREKMGLQAHIFAQQNFSRKKQAEQTKCLYEESLNKYRVLKSGFK